MHNDEQISKCLFMLANDIPIFSGVRIVAALVNRSKIVSFGFGHEKTHPFQKLYGKNEDAIFWHAETHAIHNAKKKDIDPAGMDLYVMRLKLDHDHNTMIGLAKPCAGCTRCIKDHKIARVFFTVDSQLIVGEPNRLLHYMEFENEVYGS